MNRIHFVSESTPLWEDPEMEAPHIKSEDTVDQSAQTEEIYLSSNSEEAGIPPPHSSANSERPSSQSRHSPANASASQHSDCTI